MSDDTLEQLVQEFERGVAAPPPAQPPPPSPQQQLHQADVDRHARDAAVAEHQHQRNERALADAVKSFKRDGLSGESDVVVEGYLLAKARRDPAFNEAVSSGDARRADAALAAARRDYQAEISGEYIETDTLRARASVRAGAEQPEAPSAIDLVKASRMTDQEWAADVAKRTGAVQARQENVWTGDARSVAASPWAAHDRPGAGGGPQSRAAARSRPIVGRGR
jgi:hypothetical protein